MEQRPAALHGEMTQTNVTRLKELLFDEESRALTTLDERLRSAHERVTKSERAIDALVDEVCRLDQRMHTSDGTLRSRLTELAQRVDSEPVFESRVGAVLHRSLASAEKERHRELSDAMAPMVQRIFRAELRAKTIQDELTTAIYPKLGEMVRRYVSSAMRDMMEAINRRLESGLTHNAFVLKLRSIATGRSMAELALSATPTFTVEELYLVREGSGELIHHWERDAAGDGASGGIGDNRDTLVSGFLTAITAFAKEAFAGDDAALRALDLDQHRIYLRASPGHLLAAKCSGRAHAGVETILDQSMLDLLAAHQRIETDHPGDRGPEARAAAEHELGLLLGDFAQRLEGDIRAAEAAVRARGDRFRALKVALAVIGLPLVGFAGWHGYQSFLTRRAQASVDAVIASAPALRGYPVHAVAGDGGLRIRISGLTPTADARSDLLSAITRAVPKAAVENSVAVLPSADVTHALMASEAEQARARVRERLRLLAGHLDAIRSAIPDGGERKLLDNALADVDAAARAIIATADAKTETVGAQLSSTAADLGKIAGRLSGALASRSPRSAPGAPLARGRSPLAASEEIAAISERIHILAATLVAQETAARQRVELVAALEEQARRRIAQLTQENAALARSVDELSQRLAAIRIPQVTPRQALERFTREHAIFFSDNSAYRDAAIARSTLDTLAALVKQSTELVRVVGYTDEIGGTATQRNMQISMQRSEKVVAELVARGVPRQRLVAVGRANVADLAPVSGSSTPNRRVEFEVGFVGEGAMAP